MFSRCRVWLTVVVVFCGLNSYAQSNVVSDRLALNFNTFNLAAVEQSDQFRMSNHSSNDVELNIPAPRGSVSIQLELFKKRVFADDYVRTVYHGDSVVTSDGLDLIVMDGRIKGRPETRAFVVTGDHYFFAYVDDGYDKYYYEPISFYGGDIRSNTVVIYNEKDVKSTDSKCGSNIYHQQTKENRTISTVRAGECYEVEYAVVSDFRMYQDFGNSVSQVEAFTASITGLMNGDYDTSFNDELVHVIVQNVVSTSDEGDEWLQNGSPSSIDELLDEFSAWGPSNLASHDVASLWTGYNLSGNTIGLAWLGVVCESFRYNVLEHFTSNTNQLRVLTSHEIGHNYNASHDSNSGFIMSSSVNNTSNWSTQSINAINDYYGPRATSCFEPCGVTGPGPPEADFTFNINETCVPGSVSFSDASSGLPSSWSWTFEGGDPATASCRTPNVTYSQAGSYDVTLTVSNSSGTDVITASNIIVIYDDPVASFSTQINGHQVAFNNLSENAQNYFWDFGNGQTSTIESPQVVYDEPGSYLVSLTINNVCGSNEFTSLITVESPPTARVVADKVELCTGQSVQFTDASSGNVTSRLWTFEGGSPVNSVDKTVVTQYLRPGKFDISLNVSNNVGSDEVYVQDYIEVTNSADAEFAYVLEGNQIHFNNLSKFAHAYDWNFGDGNSSTDVNPTHNYNEGGTYVVELSARNQCSEDLKVLNVNIVLVPLAGFEIEGDEEICSGSYVQFMDRSSSNVETYLWEFEGGSPAVSSDPNPLVQYPGSGTFNVSLTVTNEAGSDTETFDNYITVIPDAEAGFAYEVSERSIQFYNLSINAATYFWEFGDGNTSSENEPQHEYEADGTYEVSLKALSGCGENSYIESVEVQKSPVADFQLAQSVWCLGDTITINNLSVGTNMSFEWLCEGADISDPTAESPEFIFNAPGSYDISLTATNESGSDTYLLEEAIAIFDGVNSEVGYSLDGLNVFFTNNSTTGTHEWNFGDGNTSEELEPFHAYDQEDIYQVIHKVTNVCGMDESSIELNLFTQPMASFEIKNGIGCSPHIVQVENHSSSNAETFTWLSDGAIITGNESNPTFTYDVPGLYSITLIAVNPGGEDTLMLVDAIEVIEIQDAHFTFSSDLLVVDFDAVGSDDLNYHWSFGDGNEAMGRTVSHSFAAAGTYLVNLVVTNECGSNSLSQEVVVNELPSADFIVDSALLCSGQTVQFTEQSSQNTMGHEWIFEGGNPASSFDPNPTVTYSDPGAYDVRLIVTGIEGNDTLDRKDFIVVTGIPEITYDVEIEGNIITIENNSEDHHYSAFIFDNDTIPGMLVEYEALFNGTYTFVLTAENECGASFDTILTQIDVYPEAQLDFEVITACVGTNVTFPEREDRDGDQYLWNITGRDSIYTSEDANPTFNFMTEGIYDVSLMVENQYGVDSVKSEEVIFIQKIAPAEIQYDLNGNLVVAADINTGDYSRRWDMGDGTQLEGADIQHEYAEDGIYLLVYTTNNECGEDTFSVELEVISSSVFQSEFHSVKIYPNPTSGQVIIETKDGKRNLNIQLMDPKGKVFQEFMIKTESQINRLDLTDLPSGSYWLRISDGRKTDYMQVIVVR